MAKGRFVQDYFQGQSPWAKSVIGVIIVGGVAYGAYTIYQNSKRAKDLQAANQPGDAATAELKKLAAAGIFPTFSDVQFLGLAEQLVQSMGGCGTDEDSIYRVYSTLKNDADFLKLTEQFGVRFYQPCAWTSPIAYTEWLLNDKAYGGNIATWIGYDLDSGEIRHINSILSSNRISYSY